jgi:hypothetical protein
VWLYRCLKQFILVLFVTSLELITYSVVSFIGVTLDPKLYWDEHVNEIPYKNIKSGTYDVLFFVSKYFQSWGRSGHLKSAFKLQCLYLADVRHY